MPWILTPFKRDKRTGYDFNHASSHSGVKVSRLSEFAKDPFLSERKWVWQCDQPSKMSMAEESVLCFPHCVIDRSVFSDLWSRKGSRKFFP